MSLSIIEILEPRRLLSVGIATLVTLPTGAKGGMVIDSSGNIFGVTQGSTTAAGTLYEVLAGQTVPTILESFSSTSAVPAPNLSIDSAGDVFGDIPTGGQNSTGAIFEIPAGTQTVLVLASYTGTDGAQLGDGVVSDLNGDLFVLAEVGTSTTATTTTTTGTGAILELPSHQSTFQRGQNSSPTQRTFTTLATFPSGAAPTGRLAIDTAGDLFASAPAGGANGDGAIYELPADNRSTISLLASFGPTDPAPQGDLISDAHGDLFGTTFDALTTQQSLSTVFELSHGSASPSVRITDSSFTGSHIQAGITRDSAGNLFGTTVQSTNSASIFEIPAKKNSKTTLATLPQVNGFLAIDSFGNLFGTTTTTSTLPNNPSNNTINNTTSQLFVLPGFALQGIPNQIKILNQPSSTIASTDISPITIDVLDSNGIVISTDVPPINVAITRGPDATLGGTLSISATHGVAIFSDLTIDTPGNYTLAFTSNSSVLAGSPQSVHLKSSLSVKIVPSPLDGSHLVISQVPASVVAGDKIPHIVVTAENAAGTTSATTTGKVSLVAGPSIKTASLKHGIATFSNISITLAGNYQIQATNTASTAADPVALTVTASTPHKLIFSPIPSNLANAGGPFAVQVNLVDRFGNPVNDESTVSLTLIGGTRSAVLSGILTQSTTDGVANFSNLSINNPGTYQIKATDASDNLHVTSVIFAILAGSQTTGAA
jgi:hypothetical protein